MSLEQIENTEVNCPRCGAMCPEIAVAIDGQCDACTGALYAEGAYDPFEDEDFDDGSELEDEDFYYGPDDEFDGQPDEYTEWQDLNGGDDWDHGQYDHESEAW